MHWSIQQIVLWITLQYWSLKTRPSQLQYVDLSTTKSLWLLSSLDSLSLPLKHLSFRVTRHWWPWQLDYATQPMFWHQTHSIAQQHTLCFGMEHNNSHNRMQTIASPFQLSQCWPQQLRLRFNLSWSTVRWCWSTARSLLTLQWHLKQATYWCLLIFGINGMTPSLIPQKLQWFMIKMATMWEMRRMNWYMMLLWNGDNFYPRELFI